MTNKEFDLFMKDADDLFNQFKENMIMKTKQAHDEFKRDVDKKFPPPPKAFRVTFSDGSTTDYTVEELGPLLTKEERLSVKVEIIQTAPYIVKDPAGQAVSQKGL